MRGGASDIARSAIGADMDESLWGAEFGLCGAGYVSVLGRINIEMDDFRQYIIDSILFYIERQKYVPKALLDISPRHLLMVNDENFRKILQPYIELYDEKINTLNQSNLQTGIWNEWRYWIHGIGCRLTHLHTQEPLEWDAPDVNGFRFEWFWAHFLWRRENHKQDTLVEKYWSSEYHLHSERQIFMLIANLAIIQTREDGISFLR
jgi:hypothetical protein